MEIVWNDCLFFCELLDQIPLSYRFIEKPHRSKDTDELTDAAEVVNRDIFDGKRWLQVKSLVVLG